MNKTKEFIKEKNSKSHTELKLCDHPEDDIIQTNGYRSLCLKCGRNIN